MSKKNSPSLDGRSYKEISLPLDGGGLGVSYGNHGGFKKGVITK